MRAGLIVLVTLLVACTNRQIYEGAQTGNQLDCYKRPESQIDECLQQNSKSYEQYQREREALK